MIKNEKQFHNTVSLIGQLQDSMAELRRLPVPKGKEWLRQSQRQALKAQLVQLQQQVEEYLALKTGKKVPGSLSMLKDLPTLLIQWRIYNGWTQKQLAEKLGWHYQQLQDYERTDYATATLQTIEKVTDALMGASDANAV
jgi:HTH-type transcriptional regulator/antitoxin HigA